MITKYALKSGIKKEDHVIANCISEVSVKIGDKVTAEFEQDLKVILNPRPKYIPRKIWKYMVNKVISCHYLPLNMK